MIVQSYKDPTTGRQTSVRAQTVGKETTYTFNHLYFNTNYSFDVMAVFSKTGQPGKGNTFVQMTGNFSAPVGPLQRKIQATAVVLSWSAPRTINLKRDLKVNTIHVTFVLALRRKSNGLVSRVGASHRVNLMHLSPLDRNAQEKLL